MANKFEVTSWGVTDQVWANITKYANNNTLAIQLYCCDGPYATMTVNIEDSNEYASDNRAYVDVNNCPWAEDMIIKNGLGRHTGIFGVSGYCTYPLYEFYLEKF